MELLDQVREAAEVTSKSARFVAIQHAAIETYAALLPLEAARAPELDPATHFFGDPDGTLAYVVQLDAINFGSGYFPVLTKRAGMSGYFTVASSLKDCFEVEGPLTAEQLQRLTAQECSRIFGQEFGAEAAVDELMGLFAQALNDLGRYVHSSFGGSFRALVDTAQGSAERLVGILAEMPFYRDVGFYKRAQLTAADLSLARVATFSDLDRLTIFADNLVPHVLRVDGILRYAPGLLERIEREELIPSGSSEETEIRASALHAVELIRAAAIRQHAEPVTSMQLDYVLWNRGQEPAYKARPRHRTRTVFY
jgi:Potential Queuosine, Q, salvage protein family